MSGYYEWAQIAGRKLPYFIRPIEDGHWFLAGLGETWLGPAGPVESFTVITTQANRATEELHHRMPVILGPECLDAWLDPNTNLRDLKALLQPCPEEWVQAWEVGPAVGNTRNDGPDLVKPLSA